MFQRMFHVCHLPLHSLMAVLLVQVALASLISREKHCGADAHWQLSGQINDNDNLQLQAVQVITRHGDRTPTGAAPADIAISWNCIYNPSGIESPSEGSSSYVSLPPSFFRKEYMYNRQSIPGNCTKGQLTDIGARQHQLLGEYLRSRYIEHYNLIPTDYDASYVYVRSTDVPRTVDSAQNLLNSMFFSNVSSSGSAVAVPILTVESSTENMHLNPSRCPRIVEIIVQSLIQNSTVHDRVLEILASITPEILEIFHTDDPLDALIYYDNLNARFCHNLSQPAGMNDFIFSQMTDAYWLVGEEIYYSTYSIGIGPFIEELLNFLEMQQSNVSSIPAFMLFSGHDTTVAPILSAFGVYSGEWPPYASHMEFELFKDKTNSSYFVRMLYNGNAQIIPGCNDEFCPFPVFQSKARAAIPQNETQDCKVTTPELSGLLKLVDHAWNRPLDFTEWMSLALSLVRVIELRNIY